jgi:hypothetical protein
MAKIDRSLALSRPVLDCNLFFIRFRTEKERSPSVFATGSVSIVACPPSAGPYAMAYIACALIRP